MRGWRLVVPLLAGAFLLMTATPAGAMVSVSLHGTSCDGVSATGMGLPARSALAVSLQDAGTGQALKQRTVRTDAAGSFSTRLDVALVGVSSVKLVVARPGGATIAWASQTLHRACPLANTGPGRAGPLIGVGASALLLGLLLLSAFGYQGRHARGRTRPHAG